jgi:hypothetical protein
MVLTLPCGKSVRIPRCSYFFRKWQGKPLSDTYGRKAVLDIEGKGVFAELAILGFLRKAGCDGVWVDSYRGKFRRSWPEGSCDLPPHARALYDRIRRANGGKRGGCFDVFAWKGRNYLFVESKRRSHDAIRPTQKAWVQAALRSGVPRKSLLICEWDFQSEQDGP